MLTRPQIHAFTLVCRHLNAASPSEAQVPSILPKDLIRLISGIGFDAKSNLACLLHHIATDPNPAKVSELLGNDSRLLLQAGNVKTASGDVLECVTPYVAALAVCDHYADSFCFEMIKLIAGYFQILPDGETERQRQLSKYAARYLTLSEGKNQVYYFGWIVDTIMRSSNNDVQAALVKKIRARELSARLTRLVQSPFCTPPYPFRFTI